MTEKPTVRKVAEQEEQRPSLKIDLRSEAANLPDKPPSAEANYLKRKLEVTQQDYEEFLQYQQEKARQTEVGQARRPVADAAQPAPPKANRRSFLTVVAGTAAVGEAAALAYTIKNQDVPAHGLKSAGDTYTEAQSHNIERELINPRADIGGRGFGNWVLLMPTKMGGGTYAVDLGTGRALARISYWPYGDFNPISHHLCAFPSADPRGGFEWVNSTQGGKNSLIYGIPTDIETPDEGFRIYRVRYDGAQMEVLENVAETTGLGLGVHVCVDPKTAERYFVTDG